jgi:tRNA (guanine26-N2/guanine27-N2)-dimethyltransferase
MPFPFPTKEIREGAAQLLVPDVPRRKGPGTAGPWPFYNPTMTVNRDMAAMALAKWPRPLGSVLDGLSATGAWGIRMHLESGPISIAFNDRSVLATDLIRENLRRNGITGEVTRGDLRTLLRDARFDFVDIDPFGTPEDYVGPLLESAPIGSGFGLTATDTAVLGGTYPDTCVKRYGARPVRCPQGMEIGLRILLGFCEREAARFGKGVRPLVSFAAEHFLRIFGVVEGRTRPSALGFVSRPSPGEFVPSEEANSIGPLWMGSLQDAAFLRQLSPSTWTMPTTTRLLSTLQGEADLPPFFVTTEELAARERGSPPKTDAFLGALRDLGYRAARTHLHPRGVRTDAPFDVVLSAFRERMPTGSKDGSRPAS